MRVRVRDDVRVLELPLSVANVHPDTTVELFVFVLAIIHDVNVGVGVEDSVGRPKYVVTGIVVVLPRTTNVE